MVLIIRVAPIKHKGSPLISLSELISFPESILGTFIPFLFLLQGHLDESIIDTSQMNHLELLFKLNWP